MTTPQRPTDVAFTAHSASGKVAFKAVEHVLFTAVEGEIDLPAARRLTAELDRIQATYGRVLIVGKSPNMKGFTPDARAFFRHWVGEKPRPFQVRVQVESQLARMALGVLSMLAGISAVFYASALELEAALAAEVPRIADPHVERLLSGAAQSN